MQITKENMGWAIRKLARFRNWRGFPDNPDGIDAYARALLRIVHNKPCGEVLAEAMAKNGSKAEIDWEKKGVDPSMNDADWLLDLVYETFEFFPQPIDLRRTYERVLPAAVTRGD